jgi:hypothetical protein
MLNNPGCLIWWVAPFYKELVPATQKVRKLTPKNWIKKKLETQESIRYLQLFNNSECFFHSADREDSMRGSAPHGMVIDEAASLKETRWNEELQPSTIDHDAWVIFIGTPKGKNWFSRLRAKGEDPQQSLYKSWRFSSYSNTLEYGGFLKKESIDTIANDLPEMIRRQEIEAEELEGEGVVFRNINRQIKQLTPYKSGEQIAVGTDYGKTVDFTVHLAIRYNGEIVGFDRYNTIDWHFQRGRTINFCKQYGNPNLMVDSTGVGDPIYDELHREYSNVAGYKITNTSKKQLVENLSLMLDEGRIWFPCNPSKPREIHPDYQILKDELELFAYEITPSHNIQYNAPEGYHDDTVIALALAAWQLKTKVCFQVSRGPSIY